MNNHPLSLLLTMDKDDLILEPMFYMDDTRSAAHILCPKCNKTDSTIVAIKASHKMLVYFGCRRCRFRWK